MLMIMFRKVVTHALAALTCVGASAPASHAATRPLIPVWDVPAMTAACERALQLAQAEAAALERPSTRQPTVGEVFGAWDRLRIALDDAQGPIELLANVSPAVATRAAAETCLLRLRAFSTELLQNREIYARFQHTAPPDRIGRKLRQDVLEAFEDTGVSLPAEPRARMKNILQRLEEIRQSFDRNVRDNKTRPVFSADEVKGLPAPYLAKAKRDDSGNFLLGFAYPEYDPFMANAENEAARRRYYVAFTNRGTPQNLDLLGEASRLRREIASLYGLPSYAHFVLRCRMAGNLEAVQRFLAEVKGKIGEIERSEIAELRAFKAEHVGMAVDAVTINAWDLAYYQEQLKKARYDIDQEALRAYFPTDAAIAWVLAISGHMYGLRFTPANVAVWDPSVRYFDVNTAGTGKFRGGIYLDLFPRDGKYTHAAAFGVRRGSLAAQRTPISVLVTNFNRTGLDHRELQTLLHEFGHVLHGVLAQAHYASLSGTRVERDFVEAPSQLYEEWARQYQPLRLLHDYCAGCPAVDEAFVKRLRAARAYGQGIRYSRQHLYAAYDMALTGSREVDPLAAWVEMEAGTPVGYVAGMQFPGTFAHLIGGYAAGYYGYMWSQVLALDMLSAYGTNLLNPVVGRRFRDLVLSQGGQRPAATMVREFLGRQPLPQAFFDEIMGRRGH